MLPKVLACPPPSTSTLYLATLKFKIWQNSVVYRTHKYSINQLRLGLVYFIDDDLATKNNSNVKLIKLTQNLKSPVNMYFFETLDIKL